MANQYLRQTYRQSLREVLRPDFKPMIGGHRNVPLRKDYIIVPRLSTQGEWRVLDMLTDDSVRNVLAAYNAMTRQAHRIHAPAKAKR